MGIEDVQQLPPKQIDQMETFWLGETLSEWSSPPPSLLVKLVRRG